MSLDLRPSKNTKNPLLYRQGVLLSNLPRRGTDAIILPRYAMVSIWPDASGVRLK
jgi:hypothetical protein